MFYIHIIYVNNKKICKSISFNNDRDHTVVNDKANDQNKVEVD